MNKLRCLLISTPIKPTEPPYNIPLGLAYLAGVITEQGHDVAIFDNNAHRLKIGEIVRHISGQNWDIIGIGGLVTTYSWQKEMFKALREEFPNALLIAGGGLASSLQEELMKWVPEIDVLCIGEGENVIRQVLENFPERNWAGVRGICYRQDEKVLRTPAQLPLSEDELNRLPLPRYDLIPLDEIYFKHSGIPLSPEAMLSHRRLSIETSRGCPYHCTFCIDLPTGTPRNTSYSDQRSLIPHKGIRYYDPKRVVGLIKYLRVKYAVDFLSFTDENFTANRKYVMEFCDLMEQEGLTDLDPPLRFGATGHVNTLDSEILERLKSVGCSYLDLGLESMNDIVLSKDIEKGATASKNEWGMNLCLRAGIYPITNFMIGLPGETVQSVYDLTKFIVDNRIECGPFFVTPYPMTGLFERYRTQILEHFGSLENFVIKCEDDIATDFVVNLTRYNDAELLGMRQMAMNHDVSEIIQFAQQKGERLVL